MSEARSVPVLLIHGGGGPARATYAQLAVLEKALKMGYASLAQGGSALDAVERSIRILETSGRFNAGRGGKLQLDGQLRLDASLMEGKGLRAGAVAGIQGIRFPISVARLVMEKSPHVLLAGSGADRFARLHGVRGEIRPSARQIRLWRQVVEGQGARFRPVLCAPGPGTVGAAALDRSGLLAAGASTGGINVMLPGRVGDTPLIGSGVYADNRSGAVSMTGDGEMIIRSGLAKEITLRLERGQGPEAASKSALERMRARTRGEGGALVVARSGSFALVHTTKYMLGGYRSGRRGRIGDRFISL